MIWRFQEQAVSICLTRTDSPVGLRGKPAFQPSQGYQSSSWFQQQHGSYFLSGYDFGCAADGNGHSLSVRGTCGRPAESPVTPKESTALAKMQDENPLEGYDEDSRRAHGRRRIRRQETGEQRSLKMKNQIH
ncbi:putative uncharacterized protein C6orf52 homolog isoform X2 [Suricata suricatta]|uniref:putative uncharacterized protein C6orf52 homolog isoform X2 n=1 Tax=Suricata suricatta TaxID=37032 RepID=UPI001155F043|nr:putative uncharacterized protein C6orf52 homolog isoform X2 [Suricata suricatta]